MKWVTVKNYEHRYEAELAKQRLENDEISSFVKSDDVGGLHPGLTFSSGVKLQVLEDDLEIATKILSDFDAPRAHLEIVNGHKKKES